MGFDYRDDYFYGQLDDVLDHFKKKYILYRIVGKIPNPDGTFTEVKKKYIIWGSLQTWRRSRNYSEDGVHTSSRTGKFLTEYRYKLKDGDIIQKDDNFYRVVDTNDYDYAGVHDFLVERMGLDEIQRYNFDEFLEAEFS